MLEPQDEAGNQSGAWMETPGLILVLSLLGPKIAQAVYTHCIMGLIKCIMGLLMCMKIGK